MQKVEIIGYYRNELGKKVAKDLRADSLVPCVLYGGEKVVHFSVPMILFRELIYTPKVRIVELNVEGDKYNCILQDFNFHPVSDIILHADFLAVSEDKEVKMAIPVKFVGTSVGLQKGGKLIQKVRTLKVRALPQNMPDFVEVSIEGLDLGKSVRVSEVKQDNFTILSSPMVTIASIGIPRALKQQQGK